MKLWNVFRMEIFKNLHDRTSLFVMLVLMCTNTIGGLVASNHSWVRTTGSLEESIMWLFVFSAIGTAAFLFIYPYQMARTDYKNNVMSLMIASGVSRVQYYFVKVGATLLFSFVSVILLTILPMIIVLLATGGIEVTAADVYIELGEAGRAFGVIIFWWLSTFSMIMTSVIITRGKAYTIFVFFGILVAASQFTRIFRGLLGVQWWRMDNTVTLVQHFITMLVVALIGILILRRQDL